jgi:hypothetical protein
MRDVRKVANMYTGCRAMKYCSMCQKYGYLYPGCVPHMYVLTLCFCYGYELYGGPETATGDHSGSGFVLYHLIRYSIFSSGKHMKS